MLVVIIEFCVSHNDASCSLECTAAPQIHYYFDILTYTNQGFEARLNVKFLQLQLQHQLRSSLLS